MDHRSAAAACSWGSDSATLRPQIRFCPEIRTFGRRPMKPIREVWLLLCLVFATGAVHAQGVGSSGNITGTVSDPSGAGIPKATILAVETDKGIQHTTETDTSGEYRLVGLPPATYDVTVKISGFQTAVQKSVILTVGATVVADFQLKLAPALEMIEVNAEPSVVETQRGSQ